MTIMKRLLRWNLPCLERIVLFSRWLPLEPAHYPVTMQKKKRISYFDFLIIVFKLKLSASLRHCFLFIYLFSWSHIHYINFFIHSRSFVYRNTEIKNHDRHKQHFRFFCKKEKDSEREVVACHVLMVWNC